MGTVLTAIVWAIIGAIFYKVSSSIVWAGKYTLFAKRIIYHSLFLMASVVEDLAFIRTLKYKELENSDLTEEQINFIKGAFTIIPIKCFVKYNHMMPKVQICDDS